MPLPNMYQPFVHKGSYIKIMKITSNRCNFKVCMFFFRNKNLSPPLSISSYILPLYEAITLFFKRLLLCSFVWRVSPLCILLFCIFNLGVQSFSWVELCSVIGRFPSNCANLTFTPGSLTGYLWAKLVYHETLFVQLKNLSKPEIEQLQKILIYTNWSCSVFGIC